MKLTNRELRIINRALNFIEKNEKITDAFKKELKPIIDKIDEEIIIV